METVLIFLLIVGGVLPLEIKDIVIIILSQPNDHHMKLAENLKRDVEKQASQIGQQEKPAVYLSHRDFPHVGHWTVLPLIQKLYSQHRQNETWFLFVEDRTEIRIKILWQVLQEHDLSKPSWLGHAVHDTEATIIHHFAFYENPTEFKFTLFGSGIAINGRLLERLSARLKEQNKVQSDFGIDSSHELALFIWDKNRGEAITNDRRFCLRQGDNCATFPKVFQKCGVAVQKENIFFAVKTCSKYHKDRVPVVKKTWAQFTPNIEFFSDEEDVSIPTRNLGIPNTPQGHCAKTIAILKFLSETIQQQIQWIVIADDDTILGVSRIQNLLSCYNSTSLVALGERYGFNVQSPRGYNYITGGGGMIFSRPLLKKMIENCDCPSLDAPDDMFLGLCITNLGISITHSPLFHQARPVDYPEAYLVTSDAISFHKHWMLDPIGVYKKWFERDDLEASFVHSEL